MAVVQVITSQYPDRDTLTPELITFSSLLPACSSAPSAVTIVLAVIGSVVLIGIILLGLWKLLVTIHDRREFDRFQSERSRARYEMVSPGLGCSWNMGRGFTAFGDECTFQSKPLL